MTAEGQPVESQKVKRTIPVHKYLTEKIEAFKSGQVDGNEYTNQDLAELMGFDRPRPNIVSMLKTGSMRLPPTRVASTAKALQVDPVELMELVTRESYPGLWEALEVCLARRMITENEWELLKWLRREAESMNPDWVNIESFLAEIRPAVHKVVAKGNAALDENLSRMERDRARGRSGRAVASAKTAK